LKIKFATFLIALMTVFPVSQVMAADALKIGYVNTQRIFRDAPSAVRAAKKIEAAETTEEEAEASSDATPTPPAA